MMDGYRLQAGPVGYVRQASGNLHYKLTIGEVSAFNGNSASLRWRLARENGWYGPWEATPEAAVSAVSLGLSEAERAAFLVRLGESAA